MKKIGFLLFSILLVNILYAQDDENNRKAVVYFGVQTNQLLRQLVNFGGSNTIATNPYILNFSVNSRATGNGFNMGLGYSFDQFDDGDVNFDRTSKISDFALRAGFDKKVPLGERWQVSWGIDGLVTDNKNETTVEVPIGINVSTKLTTINRTYQFGLGGRFGVNFIISDHVLLGTEMSYYFKSGRTKFFEGDIDSDPDRDSKVNSFKPELPSVLYLILRF